VQRRIQDYGSPVTASSLKSLSSSFSGPAILSGFDFAVEASDRLRIGPGTAITDQGVIITETEAKSLTIPISAPADFTVYYYHIDQNVSGGVAASLTLASGILYQENVEGVILGYIRYPGGGVALDSSFFVQPLVQSIGKVTPSLNNSKWVVPVNQNGYVVTSTSGATLNYINAYESISTGTPAKLFLKIQNNLTSGGNATLLFPQKVMDRPFSLFEGLLSVDVNATLTCSFIDSSGTVFQLGTMLSGVPNFALYRMPIPKTSIQNPSTVVYVKLECAISASRAVRIQAIGTSEYNLYF
jgi:hypothetical protein